MIFPEIFPDVWENAKHKRIQLINTNFIVGNFIAYVKLKTQLILNEKGEATTPPFSIEN
jgi:hypothetical protein